MPRARVLLFDMLFVAGWLGGLAVAAMLLRNLCLFLFTGDRLLEETLDRPILVASVATVVLWAFLTGLVVVQVRRDTQTDPEARDLWTRILILNCLVAGPTAYHLSRRPPSSLARSRWLLDILDGFGLWGSALLPLVVAAIFVVREPQLAIGLFLAFLVLLVLIPGAALLLISLLLVDVARRPRAEWAGKSYLILLNVFTFPFGTRRYYRRVLRPELA